MNVIPSPHCLHKYKSKEAQGKCEFTAYSDRIEMYFLNGRLKGSISTFFYRELRNQPDRIVSKNEVRQSLGILGFLVSILLMSSFFASLKSHNIIGFAGCGFLLVSLYLLMNRGREIVSFCFRSKEGIPLFAFTQNPKDESGFIKLRDIIEERVSKAMETEKIKFQNTVPIPLKYL